MRHALLSPLLLVVVLLVTPAEAQLLPVSTTSEEARAHFERGRKAAHHYQFVEAIEHLDAAIAVDPTFVLALLHRGGSAAYRSELEDYLSRAAANRDQVSEGEQQMIDAFDAFLLEHDYDRAVEIFSALSEKYPDDPYLPSYLGLRYYRNLKRYDEAAAQFRRALARDPQFVQAYNWLGRIAMDQGNYEGAEETFERYIRLAPDEPRPYNSLGVLYLHQGRYEEAARLFEQALARDPRFVESRDNLARVGILQANLHFEQTVERRDAAALAALYAETGQLLAAERGAFDGTDAIEQFWQGMLDAGLTGAGRETREVYAGADSDLATEVGRYRLAAGDREANVGKYVVVWLHTPEGWKRFREIWTTDGAPAE